ncbi:EPIDERMAL PATTERNING FACTOR-like protein 9 [Mercurialis annua]|uniref:EPIDERMAL PATTERNING FACTOR-like protein 9 n=1 Tax=Mercurialis annua TaxID=3986 RepID=UPI002160DADA|nr:EPIDERMAL PATTERNING FACTOR-like protein 9 [Mercurialis annua]
MANIKLCNLIFIIFCSLLLSAYVIQGSRTRVFVPSQPRTTPPRFQGESEMGQTSKKSKRVMIGSTAPTCTYNECRGCKYRCRAEQVPVEGNDPINSPYHYKCVCHR